MTATAEVSRVKLEEPGSSLEIAVEYVTPEKIGEFDYWLIGGRGVETLVPKKSLEPQLDRVGVASAPELVGHRIRLSRSEKVNKYNKPYWNLDGLPKNGAVKPSATPEKPRITANVPEKDLPPELRNTAVEETAALHEKIGFDTTAIKKELAVYQALTEYVLRDIEPIYQKAKIGMSPESAAACVATLFINAVKK